MVIVPWKKPLLRVGVSFKTKVSGVSKGKNKLRQSYDIKHHSYNINFIYKMDCNFPTRNVGQDLLNTNLSMT